MCEKDKEIVKLKIQLAHESKLNKLISERELMFWQMKNEERKYRWVYPALFGAGMLALIQVAYHMIK